MAVKWGVRRQILYYIVGAIILIVLSTVVWQTFFVKAPLCNDAVQNGQETGIDCGGVCAALCPDTAKAPSVLWARSFETSPGVYSAAAYIQNNNASVGAGAHQVHYSFQLLDSSNILIAEREGVADIPPVGTVPIVETGIDAGTRVVARTFFNFSDGTPISWSKVNPAAVEKVRISQTGTYANARLTAVVANDSFDDIKKVVAIAVLFDAEGIARAASKATIAKIAGRSQTSVTFTWPEDVPDIIRAEVTVLPSF